MENLCLKPTGDVSELRKHLARQINYPKRQFLQMEDLLCLCEYHCFTVWIHKKDLIWASYMWPILIENGLANSGDAHSKLEAVKNFICLSIIHNDFCLVYLDERHYMEDDEWDVVIKSLFPELQSLVEQVPDDEFFASIVSTERRRSICESIVSRYSKHYKDIDEARLRVLEDLIGTVTESFPDEPAGNYIPFRLLNYKRSNENPFPFEGLFTPTGDAFMFIYEDMESPW